MIYYYNNEENFTDEDLKKSYLLLPFTRRKKIAKYNFLLDKKLSAIAYLLLRYALKREYKITEICDFDYGMYGKPYLKDYPSIKFNITHCKHGVACVISKYESGIDAEFIKPENIICSDSALAPNEIQLLKENKNPEVIFTRLWTIKESYLKNIGIGLIHGMNKLDFSSYNTEVFEYDKKIFCVRKINKVFLTVCAEEYMEVNLVRTKDLFY